MTVRGLGFLVAYPLEWFAWKGVMVVGVCNSLSGQHPKSAEDDYKTVAKVRDEVRIRLGHLCPGVDSGCIKREINCPTACKSEAINHPVDGKITMSLSNLDQPEKDKA